MIGSFPTEEITLIKMDGSIIENYIAHVQPELIMPKDNNIVIDIGDIFERTLQNGAKERYEVIDPRFYEKIGGFNAHYQLKVRKIGLKDITTHKVTYNLNGPNSRVNNNSTDNSKNVVNDSSDILLRLIEELKKEICLSRLSTDEIEESLEVVEVVESQVKSEKPSKRVISSMINSLPKVVTLTNTAVSLIEILKSQGIF